MDNARTCSTIAFYGFRPTVAAMTSFFEQVIDWLTRLGLPPDEIIAGRPELGDLVGPLDTIRAQLFESTFADVRSWDITVAPSQGGGSVLNFRAIGFCNGGDFAIVSASESFATLTSASMLPLARNLARSLEPGYGIGYRRELEKGAAVFALGALQGTLLEELPEDGSEEDEEYIRICKWGSIGMPRYVYREGELRDVFPWNFLNAKQRSAQVGGIELAGWINEDDRRGRLTPISSELTLWEVDDTNLAGIRQVLKQHGLLFGYDDHSRADNASDSDDLYGQITAWAESEIERNSAGGDNNGRISDTDEGQGRKGT